MWGGANLNNLAKLMSNDTKSAKLRRIVVTKTAKATFLSGLSKDVSSKGDGILSEFCMPK